MAMRRGSRNKRTTNARNPTEKAMYTLTVHGSEYGEELVINPDCFPDLKLFDLVEITQPDRDHERLILQVTSLAPVRGKVQISILRDVAAQFHFEAFYHVMLHKLPDARDVTVDYVELTFKDQFLSRADLWRYKVAMMGKCVYVAKTVELLGIRSQVEGLLRLHAHPTDKTHHHHPTPPQAAVGCGVIGADTKLIVRSRSSRLFWLIQMSTEMWEFASDGELYYEKLLKRLLSVLMRKWNESSVSHSVTIIMFSRSFYDRNQFPVAFDPLDPLFTSEPMHSGFGTNAAQVYGPTIHVDADSGRYYEDFYKVVVMNYTGNDWNHVLSLLKREFAEYPHTHRWRLPEECMPADYVVKTLDDANESPKTKSFVRWKSLPYGVPSRAASGNMLEAINVTLNILDKHYMDRDLNRTGQSIVMITAGSSIFYVNERLAQITKQRMMDNGVGMDMISLATPPLHVVPLFIGHPDQPEHAANEERTVSYSIPHWVNLTFLDFDCQCKRENDSNRLISHRSTLCECQVRLNQTFQPLPPFRMFDLTAPMDNVAFPITLKKLLQARPLEHDTERRRLLSDMSEALSSSSWIPSEQWQIAKSPDFDALALVKDSVPPLSLSPPSSLCLGLMTRDAFQVYDDAVFALPQRASSVTSPVLSPSSPCSQHHSAHGPRLREAASSSMISSILSPRNEVIVTPKVMTTVKRVPTIDSFYRHEVVHPTTLLEPKHESPVPASPPNVLLSKSVDSTHRFISKASCRPPLKATLSSSVAPPPPEQVVLRRSRVSTSNVESLVPKTADVPASFQSLSRSMTMLKHWPVTSSMYRDHPLLSTSPPKTVMNMELHRTPSKSMLRRITSSDLTPTAKDQKDGYINPFKYSLETLENASQRITSDRRRWSHLFPSIGSDVYHATTQHGLQIVHFGPNWKSLTSPAILPLTTDYYPSPKELHVHYTESFYTLTLPSMADAVFPKYRNHHELLVEMVCQRLASDFQLVATDHQLNDHSQMVFHLSMGHRIHQMIYDQELQTIELKRYMLQPQRLSTRIAPFWYRYSLFVDRVQAFQPCQQFFYEFPQPEDNWNSVDHLLCGYHDEMTDLIKCRRIRFAILPPRLAAEEHEPHERMKAFETKFSKFIEYLQSRTQNTIRINVASTSNFNSYKTHTGYKISCAGPMASSSKKTDCRNEWVMVLMQDTMDAHRTYHLDVRWLACSGIAAEEFVSTLRRKAKQAGVELRRIPEYACLSYLQIHPLIAPIYLPTDTPLNDADQTTISDELTMELDFCIDDQRLADANGIGYGLGLGREERAGGLGTSHSSGALSSSSSSSVIMTTPRRIVSSTQLADVASMKMTNEMKQQERWRERGYTQFMHRVLPVFVRLHRHGLVWIPSYDYDEVRSDPTKINDLFHHVCQLIHANHDQLSR